MTDEEAPRQAAQFRLVAGVDAIVFEAASGSGHPEGTSTRGNVLVRPVGGGALWSIPRRFLQQIVEAPTAEGAVVLADGLAWQRGDHPGDWERVGSTHSTSWANGPGKANAIEILHPGRMSGEAS